jgi:hypothetical protein
MDYTIFTAWMRKPDKDGIIRESAMAKPDTNPARAICEAAYKAMEDK